LDHHLTKLLAPHPSPLVLLARVSERVALWKSQPVALWKSLLLPTKSTMV